MAAVASGISAAGAGGSSASASASASGYSAAASVPGDYDFLVKTVIVGDSGVGKSALMRRFAKNEYSEHFIATIGVDFEIRHVECDGKIVKLQLWDTAGQERFRSITAAYYRGAGLIMLVVDVTSDESLASIPVWIKEVRAYNDTAPIVLVANKTDLSSKRVVTSEQLKTLASDYSLPVIETSAKANANVEEAFVFKTREYIRDKTLNSLYKPKPSLAAQLSGQSVAAKPAEGSLCAGCAK